MTCVHAHARACMRLCWWAMAAGRPGPPRSPSQAEACNSSHARVIAIPVVTLEQMRERLAENDRRLRGSPRDSRTTVMLQRISYDLNEDRRIADGGPRA